MTWWATAARRKLSGGDGRENAVSIRNMNEKDSRWVALLIGRVISYALLGGLGAALVGAICIGAAGASIGAIDSSPGTFSGRELVWIGFVFGVSLGGSGGGIAGVLIFAIQGFRSASRRSFLPPRSLLRSIALGQIVATLGVCSSFFALELVLSQINNQPFYQAVGQHLIWIMFGAPAVMVCGAIAGAIWDFRRQKEDSSATGNSENILNPP